MFLYIYSVIQGIVQGITELLPISSTAHLKIVNRIIAACGGAAPSENFNNMFDVVIQLGSILAFLVYFHEKLVPAAAFRDKAVFRKTFLLWFKSGIGLIPTAIAGFLFADYVEGLGLKTFITTLLVGGIILLFLESRKQKDGIQKIEDIEKFSYARALGVGLFQCLALIPGTSRSAATIIGGLILGEFAIEVGWFMPETILYMAIVSITNFTQHNYELGYAFKYVRIAMLCLTALCGWWGILLGTALLLVLLITSPMPEDRARYFYPLIPFDGAALASLFIRRRKELP